MMVSANSASCVPAEPMRRRNERLEEAAHVVVEAQRAERREHAGAQRVAADQRGLQHAGYQHAPGRRIGGAAETRRTARASPSSTG